MTRAAKSEAQCIEHVYGRDRGSRGSPCGKLAKVERDGKPYCGTHDPVRVAEKRAARDAEWEREQAAHDRKHRVAACRDAVIRAAREWRNDADGVAVVGDLIAAVDALRAAEAAQ